MEPKDDATYFQDDQVQEVLSVEPIAEASVSDVIGATNGVVVAREQRVESGEWRAESEQTETPSPLAGEGWGEGNTCEQQAESEQTEAPSPLAGKGWGEGETSKMLAPHLNGQLKHVLECMLFVATEPLSSKHLSDALQIGQDEVEAAMAALEETLDAGRGLQLMRVAGGFQLCTRSEYADYCALILQPSRKKLSKAALETLAVVAYRQPCTMPEVEAVRGVSVDGVMKTLMERGIIKEAGRKQTPGRPILYATTPEFLEYFGLNDISELPDIDMLAVEEIKNLEAQKELFKKEEAETPAE